MTKMKSQKSPRGACTAELQICMLYAVVPSCAILGDFFLPSARGGTFCLYVVYCYILNIIMCVKLACLSMALAILCDSWQKLAPSCQRWTCRLTISSPGFMSAASGVLGFWGFGVLASFLIMSFYSVIAGWGMSHILMSQWFLQKYEW